jgi:hypothetical protein
MKMIVLIEASCPWYFKTTSQSGRVGQDVGAEMGAPAQSGALFEHFASGFFDLV